MGSRLRRFFFTKFSSRNRRITPPPNLPFLDKGLKLNAGKKAATHFRTSISTLFKKAEIEDGGRGNGMGVSPPQLWAFFKKKGQSYLNFKVTRLILFLFCCISISIVFW